MTKFIRQMEFLVEICFVSLFFLFYGARFQCQRTFRLVIWEPLGRGQRRCWPCPTVWPLICCSQPLTSRCKCWYGANMKELIINHFKKKKKKRRRIGEDNWEQMDCSGYWLDRPGRRWIVGVERGGGDLFIDVSLSLSDLQVEHKVRWLDSTHRSWSTWTISWMWFLSSRLMFEWRMNRRESRAAGAILLLLLLLVLLGGKRRVIGTFKEEESNRIRNAMTQKIGETAPDKICDDSWPSNR